MKRYTIYMVFLAAFVLVGCNDKKKNTKISTPEVTFTKQGTLEITRTESDTTKTLTTLDIEFADDDYKIQTGLMYRTSMEDNQGMLFVFENEKPRSFYMKNTEIALDIIYVNADKEIVSFQRNAKPKDPTPLPSEKPAQYVLEVNAGLSDQWNLQTGDVLSWNRN